MLAQFSIGIVERDINNDDLFVWSYPSVAFEIQNMVIKSIHRHYPTQIPDDGTKLIDSAILNDSFMYFKYKSDWIYVMMMSNNNKDVNPIVDQVFMIISAKTFNPEKFNSILMLSNECYQSTADPTKVLEIYLSLYTTGKYSSLISKT
eukprot:gene4438-6277_t